MDSTKIFLGLVSLVVVAAALYGWVLNIIALYNSNFSAITGALVIRAIGVFIVPIGSVMGYL